MTDLQIVYHKNQVFRVSKPKSEQEMTIMGWDIEKNQNLEHFGL